MPTRTMVPDTEHKLDDDFTGAFGARGCRVRTTLVLLASRGPISRMLQAATGGLSPATLAGEAKMMRVSPR